MTKKSVEEVFKNFQEAFKDMKTPVTRTASWRKKEVKYLRELSKRMNENA